MTVESIGVTPTFPFTEFDGPLTSIANAIEKAVNQFSARPESTFLKGILTAVWESYRAVCALNAETAKTRFGMDSYTLVRGMLETYFTLLFWEEHPTAHTIRFWRSGWVDFQREQEQDMRLVDYDPAIRERIEERQKYGDSLRALLGIKDDGVQNIEWRTTPGKIINQVNDWSDEDTRLQAERLCELLYFFLSNRAHPSFTSLAERYTYAKGKDGDPDTLQRAIKMTESNVVYYAWLVVLMVLTELNDSLVVGRDDALKSLWAWLTKFRPQTRAYYEARFRALLEGPAVQTGQATD